MRFSMKVAIVSDPAAPSSGRIGTRRRQRFARRPRLVEKPPEPKQERSAFEPVPQDIVLSSPKRKAHGYLHLHDPFQLAVPSIEAARPFDQHKFMRLSRIR